MSIFPKICLAAIVSLIFFHQVNTRVEAEQNTDTVKLRISGQIDAVGNATFRNTIEFSAMGYAKAKRDFPDVRKLIANFWLPDDWRAIDVNNCRYDDINQLVEIEMFHRGFGRTIGVGRWELQTRFLPGSFDLIRCDEEQIVLHTAQYSELGVVSATTKVAFPEGTTAATFNEKTAEIRYQFEPAEEGPANLPESSSEMKVAKRLMASLGKLYSNEKFPAYWTARSVFTNLQKQPLRNYRVRFRIDGFGEWSEWKRAAIVYPGQSVVDPYFPVLDIDALAELKSGKEVSLKLERRFTNGSGEVIEESENHPLSIMAPGEVAFSNRAAGDINSWMEANELAPALLAAFCSSNDPVIQQLAGRISGMVPTRKDATELDLSIDYLKALGKFVIDNQMQCRATRGQVSKIKYGRDFLRERNGTNIDMAVFLVSAIKAVGMKCEIVLFPESEVLLLVTMPNGNQVPIDVSQVENDIDKSVQTGQVLKQKLTTQPNYRVAIDQLQQMGALPLDLESVPTDFIDKLNLRFESIPVRQKK